MPSVPAGIFRDSVPVHSGYLKLVMAQLGDGLEALLVPLCTIKTRSTRRSGHRSRPAQIKIIAAIMISKLALPVAFAVMMAFGGCGQSHLMFCFPRLSMACGSS